MNDWFLMPIEVNGDAENVGDLIQALKNSFIQRAQPITDTHHTETPPAQLPAPARVVVKRRKPKHGSDEKPDEATGLQARLLEAIKKKPMSAPELVAALEMTSFSVYTAAHELVKKGLLEAKNDEARDGKRRYFPT